MINIEVEKGGTENTGSLIRRFTKRVQGSGILPRMRSIRYYRRGASPFLKKKTKLKKIERTKKYEKLVKLGKIQERTSTK